MIDHDWHPWEGEKRYHVEETLHMCGRYIYEVSTDVNNYVEELTHSSHVRRRVDRQPVRSLQRVNRMTTSLKADLTHEGRLHVQANGVSICALAPRNTTEPCRDVLTVSCRPAVSGTHI